MACCCCDEWFWGHIVGGTLEAPGPSGPGASSVVGCVPKCYRPPPVAIVTSAFMVIFSRRGRARAGKACVLPRVVDTTSDEAVLLTVDRTELDETPDPTPALLDVLADPNRWRAYETLRAHGAMAGWRLARVMRTSEASTLKHLDALEEVGFVRVVDPNLSRRQRVWAAIPGGVRLTDDWLDRERDYRAAAMRWVNVAIVTHGQILSEWFSWAGEWSTEWQGAAEMYDYILHLDAGEFSQLAEEVRAVYRKWWEVSRRREKGQGVEGTRPVYAASHIVPFPGPYERSP